MCETRVILLADFVFVVLSWQMPRMERDSLLHRFDALVVTIYNQVSLWFFWDASAVGTNRFAMSQSTVPFAPDSLQY